LAMSGGRWGFADLWVSFGMGVWLAVALAAEAGLWPVERQLQELVAAPGAPVGVTTGGAVPDQGGAVGSETAGLCLRAGVLGLALGAVLILSGVLMVAKPQG
jgi:hypothetical protein